VGLNSNSAYYFVIIPINASSVVGVSSDCVKETYYYPLITSSEAVAVNTSSVAITHDGLYSDIDWNTDGEAIDVSGSLTNQSTSPTYISGLSSNINYYFTITLLHFRRRWLLLAPPKLGDLSADYRHPVSISSSSYFSFDF
jgi:hypothetical protein